MSGSRRHALRRWKLACALTLTVIAIAACGTTVSADDLARTQPGPSSAPDGLSIGPPPGDAVSSAATPGPTADDERGSPPTTKPPRRVTTTPRTRGPRSSPAQPAESAPLRIGAVTATGAGAFQASLGFSGATGDQVAMTRSIVSYINAHGGLGGHKIQLVSYDMDPNKIAANPIIAWQAACTYLTQDHKVTAIASYVGLAPDSFYQCLSKARVPVVTPDEGVSADFFRRYPNTIYMPQSPNYTRLLADSVDALWNAGWLTSRSRVGIVGYDTPGVHNIVDKGLTPALRRHGLKLTTGLYTATSTAAAGEYVGGVISFKAKLVDRVFFAPGGQPIYFALAAATQGYHPRYELGSLEYPTPLADNLPADQLAGSMGLGWLPYLDLPSSTRSKVQTPAIATCRKAIAGAHQDLTAGTTLGIAAWICDDWLFLRDVFATAATPDDAGFRLAAEHLSSTFRPASTFRTTFAPGRTHDGASGYRLIAFHTTCKCFAYVSNVRRMP